MQEKFITIEKIGQGTFSKVYTVLSKDVGHKFAVKKIKIAYLKKKQIQNALNQIRILASIQHENIIGYKQSFYQQKNKDLCIVMQFAQNGDLLHRIQDMKQKNYNFKQQQIWKAFINVTSGLKALHDKNIIHRDIKCANVFIDAQQNYKIGDMNVSKVMKNKLTQTRTGTPYYASPQIWNHQSYNYKSDIWSLGNNKQLGIVIYEMASLKPPFIAKSMQELYIKMRKGSFKRIPKLYSNNLNNCIIKLINHNAQQRPSCQQILNSIQEIMKQNNKIKKLQFKRDKSNILLKTIKIPKKMKNLNQILPKSRFDQVKLIYQNQYQKKIGLPFIKKRVISNIENDKDYSQSKYKKVENQEENNTLKSHKKSIMIFKKKNVTKIQKNISVNQEKVLQSITMQMNLKDIKKKNSIPILSKSKSKYIPNIIQRKKQSFENGKLNYKNCKFDSFVRQQQEQLIKAKNVQRKKKLSLMNFIYNEQLQLKNQII